MWFVCTFIYMHVNEFGYVKVARSEHLPSRGELHHHCILSIGIFSFPHCDFVGRVLALIVLVSGHCYDFT